MDISPRDVPFDDDDWVPAEPELEPDISDELTDIAPLVPAKVSGEARFGSAVKKPTPWGDG